MIGRICGRLIEKQAPELLVDVNGVGYEIHAPMSTFYQLPAPGEQVVLHIHFIVREDAQLLYGFFDKQERALFRSLIKVNGVGPKLALTILSGIEADDFVRCVHSDDSAALVKLPGVGKKTAERLIVEMRDRLHDWQPDEGISKASLTEASTGVEASGALVADAESALVALGYKPQEASRAINAVYDKNAINSEELIRAALKKMVSR
jgi:Holliday junction DNA helicase RuvA